MVDETRKVLVQFVVDADDAIQDAEKFDQIVTDLKSNLRQLVAEGKSLEAAQASIARQFKNTEDKTKSLGTNMKALSTATQEIRSEQTKTGSSTLKLANLFERVLAAAVIGFVLNAGRRLLDFLSQLTEESAEARKEFIQFVVEIRNAQRSGLDTTLREWNTELQRLGETFTQFTERDLTAGLTKIIKFGRQVGLTRDQIIKLSEDTAVLATVTGKDFADALDTIIDAAERGRVSDAFSDLVGPISETTLVSEAVARGFAATADDADELARTLTVLDIVTESAAKSGSDFSLVQKDISGILTETTANIDDQRNQLGEKLIPLLFLWNGALEGVFTIANKLVDFYRSAYLPIIAKVIASVIVLSNAFDKLSERDLPAVVQEFQNFGNVADTVLQKLLASRDDFSDVGEEIGTGLGDGLKDGSEEVSDELENLFAKLRESIIDTQEDIAKENRRFGRQLIDDTKKFVEKLKNLVQKFNFDRDKINRTFDDKIAEANQEFQEEELKKESDFQEKLRRLRENFLLDIEDALQQRDARQAIRLIKTFNLRRLQLFRERENEKKDTRKKFDDEVSDIERQRRIRLRELKLQFKFREKEIKEQFEFERALRLEDHEARLKEIRIQGEQRNQEIARKFADQEKITRKFALQIRNLLLAEFGPDGSVEGIFKYLIGLIDVNIKAINDRIEAVGNMTPTGLLGGGAGAGTGISPGILGGGAGAGTGISTSPTIPQSNLSPITSQQVTQTTPQQRSEIRIGLEKGLKAEIVDESLNQVANVVLDTLS